MPKATDSPEQARSLTAPGFSFAREIHEGRLHLRALHRPEYGPICADWLDAGMRSRIQAGRRQLLCRATGLAKLEKSAQLHVLDATGGLGRDAYTLAALGAHVTLSERHPDTLALLLDAHARAAQAAPDIAARIEIVPGDALVLLGSGRQWDAVYLDPMYPDEKKSALPQKEMQIFRDLTGGDADADALLAPALACARKRVAVKRPLHAPFLAGRTPSVQMAGTQARFDVYLV